MNEDRKFISCSCCGKGIKNNAKENVDFNVEPYPHDESFGMCRECEGDPSAEKAKEQMGWATVTFIEARFGIVRDSLSEKSQERWDAWNWEKKALMVVRLIERGALI